MAAQPATERSGWASDERDASTHRQGTDTQMVPRPSGSRPLRTAARAARPTCAQPDLAPSSQQGSGIVGSQRRARRRRPQSRSRCRGSCGCASPHTVPCGSSAPFLDPASARGRDCWRGATHRSGPPGCPPGSGDSPGTRDARPGASEPRRCRAILAGTGKPGRCGSVAAPSAAAGAGAARVAMERPRRSRRTQRSGRTTGRSRRCRRGACTCRRRSGGLKRCRAG